LKYIYCQRCFTWVEADKPHHYMGLKPLCVDQGELDLSVFQPQGEWPERTLDKSALYADTETDVMDKPDD